MRHWITILLLLIACCSFAEKRALVIGIGEYPDVDYGWHNINGDNDVPIIEEMLRCNGFSQPNINTLTNHEATYVGIVQAIEGLICLVNRGDIVYIHFSGHGQQITDLNGDESDGWDESWIPYDALQEPTTYYNGERHLIDDELNYYLHKISRKIGENGRLIVISDACHSGTATRDITDTCTVRGSSAKFILSVNTKPKGYTSQPIQWIAISACADNECNRQCNGTSWADVAPVTTRPYGSLSYALYLLRDRLSTITLRDLSQQLQSTIASLISRPQSPQVELPVIYRHTTLF